MNIIHTGDWHLGKTIEGHSRLPEQELFLNDLVSICEERQPDMIIIAGDIYDTFNPPAAANIAESVGSLFGSNKVKTLEKENIALHREVADHEETIEALQDRIQNMQADHSRQMAEVERKYRREIADKETKHKEEISFLKTVIARAAAWFPYFREMLRIENLCRLVGFDERQTATLVKGKPLEYAGELYSEEHGRKFTTEKAGFQVLKDPTDGTRLVLAIDRKPIAEWFKEQFEKLRQNIRQPIQQQRKSRGMKL